VFDAFDSSVLVSSVDFVSAGAEVFPFNKPEISSPSSPILAN